MSSFSNNVSDMKRKIESGGVLNKTGTVWLSTVTKLTKSLGAQRAQHQ